MLTKHWKDHRWQGKPVSVVGAAKIVSMPNPEHTFLVLDARRRACIGEDVRVAA